MAYALLILDGNESIVLEHIADNADTSVYVDDAESYGIPSVKWRKPYNLKDWVKIYRPKWTIKERTFKVSSLF